MTVAYADFITAFPEFANTTTYPQATVEFWLGQAINLVKASTFGTSTDLAVMLVTAHYVVLAAQRAKTASGGGIAGAAGGVIASKSVADVSVSYDTTLTATDGAGIWNATSYGQQYLQMAKAFASGPIYRPGPRRMGRFGYGW